jgi:hypothetical protein
VFAKLLRVVCRRCDTKANQGTLLKSLFMPRAKLVNMSPNRGGDERTRRRALGTERPSTPEAQEMMELNWDPWKQ